MVLTLFQFRVGTSDRGAVDNARFDHRWKLVLGLSRSPEVILDHSMLTRYRLLDMEFGQRALRDRLTNARPCHPFGHNSRNPSRFRPKASFEQKKESWRRDLPNLWVTLAMIFLGYLNVNLVAYPISLQPKTLSTTHIGAYGEWCEDGHDEGCANE